MSLLDGRRKTSCNKMSRDQRKLSRSLEECNIHGSTPSVSQISQTDNELRQKLKAINTSYKLSNKRIRNETRELKEILHGLQRELRVSQGAQYIPSLFEHPPAQGRARRTTVSSVPSEDIKQQDQQRLSKEIKPDIMARRRSGSFPPATHAHQLKKLKDALDNEPDEIQDPEDELRDKEPQTEHIGNSPHTQTITSFWVNERDENKAHPDNISQAGSQRLLVKRSQSTEQQQRGGRKKSSNEGSHPFSKVFRGRFMTNQDKTLSNGSTRKLSRAQQLSESSNEVGLHRQRPSIDEDYSSAPNQRKTSLDVPQYPWQRKRNTGNRGDSPRTGLHGRFDVHDTGLAFDSLPENLGGRRLSVAHGRTRKTSRATGLPPLTEEKTPPTLQKPPAESWSDLAKCRYLRKEEKKISIDDIFSKE